MYRINQIAEKQEKFDDIDIANALIAFFPSRTTLHMDEVYYLFFYLTFQAAQHNNIEQLDALHILINEIE